MEQIPNSPGISSAVHQHTVIVWAIFLLAGLFYGGLHALAWNVPLPSRTQQLLWRLSSGVLVFGFGLLCLFARLLHPVMSVGAKALFSRKGDAV